MKRLALLLLLPSIALAQTVDQTMPSLRSPPPPGTVVTITVQMEGRNPLTGARVLIGTKAQPAFNIFSDEVLLVDLVGPKTSATPLTPVVVTGLRNTMVIAGIPKVDIDPIVDHPKLDSPIVLPLGTFLGCRYDMPGPNFDMNQLVANVMQWMTNHVQFKLPIASSHGNLRCSVGVKAALIPAPAPPPGPGPVATGPITTQPVTTTPPAPAPGLSPDRTVALPPDGKIVTAGGTWSFGINTSGANSAILLNGAQAAAGFGVKMAWVGGNLYHVNSANDWYVWTGNGWAHSTAPL